MCTNFIQRLTKFHFILEILHKMHKEGEDNRLFSIAIMLANLTSVKRWRMSSEASPSSRMAQTENINFKSPWRGAALHFCWNFVDLISYPIRLLQVASPGKKDSGWDSMRSSQRIVVLKLIYIFFIFRETIFK